MMKFKKVLAMTLAMAMVLGSSMSVFAEDSTEAEVTNSSEGSATGTGGLEGYVSTDVFSIVLPTTEDATYTFTMDPQGLIAKTANAAYENATFEDGATVFFATSTTTEGGTTTTNYTSSSAESTITNKSSMPVSVTVTATLSNYDGITVTTDNTFADDTDASLYLALVSGSATAAIAEADDSATAELVGTIAAADSDAFEYVYDDEAETYKYQLQDDADEDSFSNYSFNLTGASNTAGDWSELTEAAPSVTVVWTIEEAEEAAPEFTGTSTGISYTAGAGDEGLASITSIYMTNTYGVFDIYNAASDGLYVAAEDTGSVITFDSAILEYYTDTENGYIATVKYVDNAGETHTVKVEDVLKN